MTATTTEGPHALVLHADPAALRSVQRSLEDRRFVTSSASDGTRGLELLLDRLLELDAIVIAADLPHRDARAFADLIRRAGGERDLAIVVLTAEAEPRLRDELLALGVDAVVDRSAGSEAATDAVVAALRARGRAIPGATGAAPVERGGGLQRWALSLLGAPRAVGVAPCEAAP